MSLLDINILVDILFPHRCLYCNDIIDREVLVCESCYNRISFTHWEAIKENPLKQRLNSFFEISDAYALMNFEKKGLSRKIIHQLKYAGNENIGKILANWTQERINLIQKPDILINIPVHDKKLKKRGYNQLHLFTETLSKAWKIPCNNNYIVKTSDNKQSQAKKDRENRSKIAIDFEIPKQLSNTHFLLIDDICTTGNTISAYARKILESPGNKISVLVMAIDL